MGESEHKFIRQVVETRDGIILSGLYQKLGELEDLKKKLGIKEDGKIPELIFTNPDQEKARNEDIDKYIKLVKRAPTIRQEIKNLGGELKVSENKGTAKFIGYADLN